MINENTMSRFIARSLQLVSGYGFEYLIAE